MNPQPQSWTRRQAIWLILGAAGGLTLHSCMNPNPSTDTLSASIAIVTWVGLTPLHIAQEKGFFQELGLELQTREFSSNPDSNAALLAGHVNSAAPVIAEAVSLAAKGADFRIVLVEDLSVGADGILARNQIRDLKDFKGQRIAVEKNGVSHFFLLQVLEATGLTEKEVTLVNMTPDAAAAAYQAGQVNIAVSYSPFLEQANAAQKQGRIIYDSSKMPTAIADLYVFETQFIEEFPQLVEAFVKGIFKGIEFLETNRAEALEIAAKRLNISPEELDENLKGLKLPNLAENLEILANPDSDLYLLKSLQKMVDFLKINNQIDTVPDLSKLIEPKFIQS